MIIVRFSLNLANLLCSKFSKPVDVDEVIIKYYFRLLANVYYAYFKIYSR